MPTIKLSEYAKRNSVTWRTAFRWYQEGKISTARKTPGGSIVVDLPDEDKDDLITVTYARVSNSDRRNTDLVYQSERLQKYCQQNHWAIDTNYKEVGSGLNDQRKQLLSMLKRPENLRIVVEHKDRLTRFGFNYLEALLNKHGSEIVVINETENDEEDLIQDLVSIVTSFCARIYGRRRAERKQIEILRVVQDEESEN